MFVVKVKKIRLINEINDVSVEVDCYLTCPDGAIYKNSNGGDIKIFTIRVSQSMLSDIVSFEEKLVETAKYIIYNEYHVVGYALPEYTEIVSDSGLTGTPLLMLKEENVKQVCVGMTCIGPGYNIEPSGHPIIKTITKKREILLSHTLHLVLEACTVDPNVKLSVSLVKDVDRITVPVPGCIEQIGLPFADIVVGLSISGNGLPPNTYIKQYDQDTNFLYLTQKALDTINTEVTISKNPYSKYLKVFYDGNSGLVMDSRYVGLTISGDGIKENTKTAEVDPYLDPFKNTPLGTFNCIKLSDYVVTGTSDLETFCYCES